MAKDTKTCCSLGLFNCSENCIINKVATIHSPVLVSVVHIVIPFSRSWKSGFILKIKSYNNTYNNEEPSCAVRNGLFVSGLSTLTKTISLAVCWELTFFYWRRPEWLWSKVNGQGEDYTVGCCQNYCADVILSIVCYSIPMDGSPKTSFCLLKDSMDKSVMP